MNPPTPSESIPDRIANYGCSVALLIVMIGAAVRIVWAMFKE